jgi:hypothetical protein
MMEGDRGNYALAEALGIIKATRETLDAQTAVLAETREAAARAETRADEMERRIAVIEARLGDGNARFERLALLEQKLDMMRGEALWRGSKMWKILEIGLAAGAGAAAGMLTRGGP